MNEATQEFYVCSHSECGYTNRLSIDEAKRSNGRCLFCGTKLEKEYVAFRSYQLVDFVVGNIKVFAACYAVAVVLLVWFFSNYIRALWHVPIWIVAIYIVHGLAYHRFLSIPHWFDSRKEYESNLPKVGAIAMVVFMDLCIILVSGA